MKAKLSFFFLWVCLWAIMPDRMLAQHELGIHAGYGSGLEAGVDYSFRLTHQWRIQTGLEVAFLADNFQYDKLNTSQTITSPSGLPANSLFYFIVDINRLEEERDLSFLNIPLLLEFQTRGKHAFYASAGMKFGIPLSGRYHQTYDRMITSGFSEYTNQTYQDMPALGFSTYNRGTSDGKLSLSPAYIAAWKTGISWQLAERIKLSTGLYLDYGLNDVVNYNKEWIEYRTSGQHQFSSLPDSYSPLSYGVELGIRFCIGKNNKTRAGVIIEKIEEVLPYPATLIKSPEEPTISENRESYEYDLLILGQPVNRYKPNQITPSRFQRDLLEEKVSVLSDYPQIRILLEGHTTADEGDKPNLGMQRAEVAKNYLVSRGIAPERIQVTDKGRCCPLSSDSTEEEQAKNRRVEVVILTEN